MSLDADLEMLLSAPPEVFWTLVMMEHHEELERGAAAVRTRRFQYAVRRVRQFHVEALERFERDRKPSKWGDYRPALKLRALGRGLRRALRRSERLAWHYGA